jgi:anti-sigma factor RsiW
MANGIHELTAAYALDALDPQERLSYEEHLGTCAPCQEELASFWETTGALAYAAAGPAPSPGLRDRILAEALRPRRWALPIAASVAAVAAIAAIGLGIWAASLNRSLDDTRATLDRARAASSVLATPGARTVALKGVDGNLVVAPEGRAALVVHDLEPAPNGKRYEIWVIRGKEAPKPAGLFDSGGDQTLAGLDRRVPPGAIVAVTVEDEDGADAPTSAPFVTSNPA